MQFIWPVKSDYRITWLNEDYSQTVVARNQRDYVWIMARTPQISAADYDRMVNHIGGIGLRRLANCQSATVLVMED